MAIKFNPFTGNLDLTDTTAAAGSDTQVQYNDGGNLAGSADLTWDDTGKELGVGGDINLDDGGTYATTLQLITPTANRTISFPDATGTVALVAGSSGQVTYNNAGAQAGLTSASIGSTGEINISLAGAASTPPVSFTGSWFTGGTATTTKPQLLIEPTGTTSTAWSTSGTGLGVNAASGFSGRLLDLQTNGTSQMVVQGDGKLGIGTTSPTQRLQVTDGSLSNFYIAPGYGGGAGTTIGVGGGEYLAFNGAPFTTERMRIDSSGRLLVGTSSALSVNSVTAGVEVHATATNNGASMSIARFFNDPNGPLLALGKSRSGTVAAGTVVQNNDELGRLVFGGDDGTDLNTTAASIQAFVDGTPGTDDMPGRLVFSTTADGASSPTERMRIDSDGTLLLGVTTKVIGQTTNPYLFFQAQSNVTTAGMSIESYGNNIATRYHFAFTNPNGVVGTISTNGTATAYNTSSDYRLKENVTAVTDGITRLQQLKPSRFNFIADPTKTVDGFLAHEVQAVVPEAITGEKDAVDDEGNPVYQGIDQSKLVPLLTAALQEAVSRIETLEQRLNDAGIN